MGVARVYFGEHWPTDVLGGYLLGTLWLVVVIELYERWRGRSGHPSRFHE
jgi:undecaprenyl-diphosphatase